METRMPISAIKPLRLRKLEGRPAPWPSFVAGAAGDAGSPALFTAWAGQTPGIPLRFRRACPVRTDMGMFCGTPDETPIPPDAIAAIGMAGA